MIADAEVVPCPLHFLEAIELIDAAGGVARSVAEGAGKLQRNIEVALRAFAVGIDHHQNRFPAEEGFIVAIELGEGASAGFHRIRRLAEAEVGIERRAAGQRFLFYRAGARSEEHTSEL